MSTSKTFNNVEINVDFSPHNNHTDNLVSRESIRTSLGKIWKWKTDFHSVVWDGDADTVNGHTILSDVPMNAAFTDTNTTYTVSSPLMISAQNNITIDLSDYATINYVDDAIDSVSSETYTLPIASDQTLGGVKIGENITIDEYGVISVDIPDVTTYIAGNGISFMDVETRSMPYIQLNGGTVFDTGVIHQAHDTIEIIVQINDITVANDSVICDSRYYNTTQNTMGLSMNRLNDGTNYALYFTYNRSSASTRVKHSDVPINSSIIYKIIMHDYTCEIYNYETDELITTIDGSDLDWVLDDGLYSMPIGNVHNSSHMHHTELFGHFRFYGMKWYREGELIHNFIPVILESSASIYDLIDEQTLTVDTNNTPTYTYDTAVLAIDIGSDSINVTPATTSAIGGVIIGTGINVDTNGVISVSSPDLSGYATTAYVDTMIASIESYTLPIATDSTLGGIMIGNGLEIDEDGVTEIQDSGWNSAVITDSSIALSEIQYRRIATGLIEVNGSFTPSSSFQSKTLFTLPSEYRPNMKRFFPQLVTSTFVPFLLTIDTDGSVAVDVASTSMFDGNAVYYIEATYLAGDKNAPIVEYPNIWSSSWQWGSTNAFLLDTGVIQSNSNYNTTSFIPIDSGSSKYLFHVKNGYTGGGQRVITVCFYDSSHTFISGQYSDTFGGSGSTNVEFDFYFNIPSGTAYIKLSTIKNDTEIVLKRIS